jgi:hypothetical protein
MLQQRHRLGFTAKPGNVVVAGMPGRQNHLERHQPLQARLPRFIHDAHAAPVQQPQHLIARDHPR